MTFRDKAKSGFSLVEVTLALGIAGFCLIVIFGLLPLGVNSNSSSIEETAAINLLSGVIADLRQTPNPSPKGTTEQDSLVFKIPIPAAMAAGTIPSQSVGAPIYTTYIGEDGERKLNGANARYRLSVWTTPSSGHQAAIVRLIASWPAAAPLQNASGRVETLVALDRG